MPIQAPRRIRGGLLDDALRLEPPAGQLRRPRLSWIAFGLVIVLASGLAGAIALARVANRQPVLALAQTLERGEMLSDRHLRIVHVAVDEDITLTSADRRGEVVGLVAGSTLPAGTLINREQFTDGPPIPSGWRVVGLALEPGEYPTSTLRSGDRVEVIETPDPARGSGDTSSVAAVLSREAEVFAVERLSETTPTLMVSIVAPDPAAARIAAAAAQDRVRLVLMAPR